MNNRHLTIQQNESDGGGVDAGGRVQQPDLLLIEFIPLGFRQTGALTDAPIAKRNRGIPKLVAQLKRIIRVEFVHAAVLYYRAISSKLR